jgi:hypothetical protein
MSDRGENFLPATANQRIVLSDHTRRIRRNLIASNFIVILIAIFGIEFQPDAKFYGVGGLTKHEVLLAVGAVTVYLIITYVVALLEEYSLWKMQLGSLRGLELVYLFDQNRELLTSLDEISVEDIDAFKETMKKIRKRGSQASFDAAHMAKLETALDGMRPFTIRDSGRLTDISMASQRYLRGFKNFSFWVGFRFWILDVLVPLVLMPGFALGSYSACRAFSCEGYISSLFAFI